MISNGNITPETTSREIELADLDAKLTKILRLLAIMREGLDQVSLAIIEAQRQRAYWARKYSELKESQECPPPNPSKDN